MQIIKNTASNNPCFSKGKRPTILFLKLLVLAVLFSCTQTNEKFVLQKGTVFIHGTVNGHENHSGVISLIVANELYEQYNSIVLADNGYFSFELELLHPQDVLIKYEKGIVQLFVRQGDSLHITLDAEKCKNELFPPFELSGNNPEPSQQIWHYRKQRKLEIPDPDPSKLSVPEYISKLEHMVRLEDSVLTAYIETYIPNDDFVVWARAFFRYQYASYLIEYLAVNREEDYENRKLLFNNTLFPVNNENAFYSSAFSMHLRHYYFSLFLREPAVIQLSKAGEEVAAYELALSNSLETLEQGLFRDVMLFATLKTISDYSFKTFDSLLPLYTAYIDNPDLKEMLVALSNANISNAGSLTADSLWNRILKDHSNHVVYVSFWATWCGPCKSEFPYLIMVEKALRGRDVAFVNICMSSNMAAWEAVKNNIPGEHYYLTDDQGKLLRSSLNIRGYPTYMIIDKTGKLIEKEATRPSQTTELIAQIEGLLEQ